MRRLKIALIALTYCIVALGTAWVDRQLFRPKDSVCFTPGQNCTQFIVDAINNARSEILVQAYGYTNKEILAALARAKKERRVEVRVILDKINESDRYPGAADSLAHGIPVLIDSKVRIAHNKVMIFDGSGVLTGSFNFTRSAQRRNAENVRLTLNDRKLALAYREYWMRRAAVSHPFTPSVKRPDDGAHDENADDD